MVRSCAAAAKGPRDLGFGRRFVKFRLATMMAAGAVLAAGGAAYAQLSPKDAVSARVNGYRETGAAFKTINDQLKSGAPAKIMLRLSAKRIIQTSHDQYGWYPMGSGPDAGVKTKAKPAIWTDAAGFKAAQDRLQQQATLMGQAVDGGDLAQIKTQAHALGEACAACHSKYREKEE
jgi:cytochrome c556